ncbi:DUF4126 domain-containing protein [Candidatus Omnitrophota bacterium]
MEQMNMLALLLGGSWASGVNLYLTTAGLGIANRFGWVDLPGQMDSLSHPGIIAAALVLYAIEFFADKVPFVDSAWDSVHTFIRPLGGVAMGYLATTEMGPALQYPVALLTGTIALDSHLTKATSRVAINTSPEPFSNTVASVTEDVSVAGILFLIMRHPIIATVIVVIFIFISIWFLKVMFKFLKKVFSKREPEKPVAETS